VTKIRLSPFVLAALLVLPSLAQAHARLEKSDPSRRATLASAPAAVRLWFNEPVEAEFSRIRVVDGAGEAVVEGGRVDAGDAKLLVLDLPEGLAPGDYTVTFEVLSVDGHRVKQSFPFSVKGAPAAEE
jgi:methionine-rich copper-binding protein CopC